MQQPGDDRAGLVLLHGSELGAWLWDPTVPRLQTPSLAIDLPGRHDPPERRRQLRLDDAISHTVAQITQWEEAGRVVLVVHSFAGVLVPGVTRRLAGRVRGVVWLGATVPAQGQSWVDLQPAGQRRVLRILYRLRPAGALSPAKQNLKALCNDLDPAVAAQVIGRRVPEVPGFLLDPVDSPLPAAVEHHYVRLLQDRTADEQRHARNLAGLPNPRMHELDAGHLPMQSQPGALAALLDAVAADPRGGPADDGLG